MMASKRLTPAQVAARLGVSIRTVYNAIRERKLKAENVCNGESRNRWRVPEEALEAYTKRRA